MKIFTPAQMRAFDKDAVEKFHIPSIVLMENAALRVVEFCEAKFAPLTGKRVLIACGKGNNGGDGFAIARHLDAAGCEVVVLLACGAEELSGDAAVNFRAMPPVIRVLSADDESLTTLRDGRRLHIDLVIDALLGTGFSGAVRPGPIKTALEYLGRMHPRLPVVAVDVPSGLNAETGEAVEAAIRADYTVTFVGPKLGFFVRAGLNRCGEIWVGHIGTSSAQGSGGATCDPVTESIAALFASIYLQRRLDAHKGDAGRVVIIGGSRGMSGAVALASRAALASGAGLCLAMVPEVILGTVAASVMEATTSPLACDSSGALIEAAFDSIAARWEGAQCVAIGPGIGRSDETLNLVRQLVRECPHPLVIDADALYALNAISDDVRNRKSATILTPHPGEMAELMETDVKTVQNDRYGIVQACVKKYDAVVVLKGAHSLTGHDVISLVGDDAGSSTYDTVGVRVNFSGNSGMATGGSGDVLTGAIAGLIPTRKRLHREDMNKLYAAPPELIDLAVYAHGLAGDLAYETKGNGLVAGDIAAHLPMALKRLSESREPERINSRLVRLQ